MVGVLEKKGVTIRYIDEVKHMYKGVVATITSPVGETTYFSIIVGLHQGSVLSPYVCDFKKASFHPLMEQQWMLISLSLHRQYSLFLFFSVQVMSPACLESLNRIGRKIKMDSGAPSMA